MYSQGILTTTNNYTQNTHTSWKEEPLGYNNIMYYTEKSRTYRSKDFFDIEYVILGRSLCIKL